MGCVTGSPQLGPPWGELALSKVPEEGVALSCVTTGGGQTLCQAAQLVAKSSIM